MFILELIVCSESFAIGFMGPNMIFGWKKMI